MASASVGSERAPQATAGSDSLTVDEELTDQLGVHVLVHGDLLPTVVDLFLQGPR
jgi:hypothetical protein